MLQASMPDVTSAVARPIACAAVLPSPAAQPTLASRAASGAIPPPVEGQQGATLPHTSTTKVAAASASGPADLSSPAQAGHLPPPLPGESAVVSQIPVPSPTIGPHLSGADSRSIPAATACMQPARTPDTPHQQQQQQQEIDSAPSLSDWSQGGFRGLLGGAFGALPGGNLPEKGAMQDIKGAFGAMMSPWAAHAAPPPAPGPVPGAAFPVASPSIPATPFLNRYPVDIPLAHLTVTCLTLQ